MSTPIPPDQDDRSAADLRSTHEGALGRRLLSRGAAIRALVACVVVVGFLAIARQIEPDQGLAIDEPAPSAEDLPTPRNTPGHADSASASSGAEAPPLGRLEGMQFDIEILGAGDETRYNVYHKSGALLLQNATLRQVEQRFPDIELGKLQAAKQIMMIDDVDSPY